MTGHMSFGSRVANSLSSASLMAQLASEFRDLGFVATISVGDVGLEIRFRSQAPCFGAR